jgi:hypothetical protein
MWQEIIVGGAVAVATLFLIRKYWPRKQATGSGCGGCQGCGSDKSCRL